MNAFAWDWPTGQVKEVLRDTYSYLVITGDGVVWVGLGVLIVLGISPDGCRMRLQHAGRRYYLLDGEQLRAAKEKGAGVHMDSVRRLITWLEEHTK